MIDLREYYLDNISEDDYYYRFYSLIEGVNRTYNVFYGEHETQGFEFLVHDEIEAIEKFRQLCRPENEPNRKEDRCWFYIVAYYLNAHGYHRAIPRCTAQAPERTIQLYIRDNQGQSRIAWARR